MSYCPAGALLYERLSEGKRPPTSTMRERREAGNKAVWLYMAHVKSCRVCGMRETQVA